MCSDQLVESRPWTRGARVEEVVVPRTSCFLCEILVPARKGACGFSFWLAVWSEDLMIVGNASDTLGRWNHLHVVGQTHPAGVQACQAEIQE